MDEKLKVAFEAARDTTNRVITLSSSMILVMVTFSKDFILSAELPERIVAAAAWVAFFASTLSGIYTLLTLTGEVSRENRDDNSKPINLEKGYTSSSLGTGMPVRVRFTASGHFCGNGYILIDICS